jgi:hypothetical protein
LRTGRRDWLWAVTFLVIAAAVLVVLFMVLTGGSDPDEPEIAGIPCEAGERLDYHVHATVSVIIDGEPQTVPANIGVKPGECIYWLHTHDDQGTIHVEAPRQAEYTLGQLFAIWGQPLSSTQLLNRTTDPNTTITATVNGQAFAGNPADIPLNDGSVIVVEFGPSAA